MKWRRQLAVSSPISIEAVGSAFAHALRGERDHLVRAQASIANEFGASRAILTDSGTSALVLALRAAVPRGGVVGLPGYACVDLTAAALHAGVRVRVYDIDPTSLSPDLDSVRRMLSRGVDAIVVAHLFGFPANVPAVAELASAAGVPVIEDAAQAAGGMLGGRRLGSFGDLSLLSFGRGKGLCAGGGGALLLRDGSLATRVDAAAMGPPARGIGSLVGTGIQWLLGRPALYALPSSLPWLHLGEMVFHPAHEPQSISVASSVLIHSALRLEPKAVAGRRAIARRLEDAARDSAGIGMCVGVEGSSPGFLRYPVRDVENRRAPDPRLGVLRSYPATLLEQPQLSPILASNEPPVPGALELRRTLYTLPTHCFVRAHDVADLQRWLAEPSATPASR